jgi:hypothetical protein
MISFVLFPFSLSLSPSHILKIFTQYLARHFDDDDDETGNNHFLLRDVDRRGFFLGSKR